MKKVISLFCVLALTLSANAMPTVKRISNDVHPILKAAQATKLTTPVKMIAYYTTGQDYNYQVVLTDANGDLCATAFLKTKSSNSIAGVYDIGVVNNKSNGYVIINGAEYWFKQGSMSIVYNTTTNVIYVGNVQELVYDIYASGIQLMDKNGNEINGEYEFSGQVIAYGVANASALQSCIQSGTNCENALLQLSEQKTNAIDVYCDDINYELTYTAAHSDEQYDYRGTWKMWTAGYDDNNKYYQVIIQGIGDEATGNIGSYASGYCDASLYIAEQFNGEYKEIEIASAYGTVSRINNNGLKYDFYLTAKTGTVYHILLYYNSNAINKLESDVDYFTSFATDQMKIEYGDMEGDPTTKWFYVELNNGKELAMMYFFAGNVDDVIKIPARTYMISPSNAAGTVQAYAGIEEDPLTEPSFIGKLVGTNTIDELSFMVDGTVSVTKVDDHAYIEVNAKNSFGRTIKFTVGEAPVTGIETINAAEVEDGKKVMVDGQLYIIRNGVMYNAQGAVVK